MSCLGTGRLPCPSIHLSGLRQCRALPKGHATGRRCVLRCQADEKDKSIADKVPEAAQRTIDALSALLGRDEDENQLAQSRPLQEEPQKEDGGVQWWSVPPSNQTAAPRRKGTDPGSAGRALNEGGPGQQRTGKPMKLGSNKFDIPTVHSSRVAYQYGNASSGHLLFKVEPYIAYGLLFLNLAVYGAGIALALTQGNDFSNDWFLSLAKMNDKVANGELYRLLTCTFLHAGLLHLGLNCFALYSIGPDVEAVMGYSTFAAIYLLSGLGGSVASFLFSDLVTVGASGAIFGLLGASAGYFLRNRALQGSTRQLGNLALIVGFDFVLGSGQGSMIDNSGHLGGLVVGLLLSLGMAPRWDVQREVDIPADSMQIPENAEEVEVVVDNQPATLRVVSAVSCALSLIILTGVGMYERGGGQ